MATAILKSFDELESIGHNSDLFIVPPSPVFYNNTKIKRWWNTSYTSTTYEGCALIDYDNVYIVVNCNRNVELKISTGNAELEFDVGFNKLGDGNVNRILVVPKEELYDPINYEDYRYDYTIKAFVKTVNGSGSGAGAPAYTFLEYTTVPNTSSFTLRATNASNNYEVDWGDGTVQNYTSAAPTHTYATADTYIIKITPATGTVYNPYFIHAFSETSIAEINGTGGTSLTSLKYAFWGAANLTSISADIDTVQVVDWRLAFTSCTSLTTFPALDTSCGTIFIRTWEMCTSLTSMPSLDFSSATTFSSAWQYCSSLATFPPNMFDSTGTITGDWSGAFRNCALTAQSIENILMSLDRNGTTNNTLTISGGSNASKTTWTTDANTAYANLISKGWTIAYNA
jgi:hypothetical protein